MTKCWFKDDEDWEMGELLSWTTRWHPDHFYYYFTAVVRRTDGNVRYIRATEVRLKEPEDWSKPDE